MKLSLPHITQRGNAIRGDCGPACVAMCANTTIDDAYNTGIVARGQFAHITNGLKPLLYHFGIRAFFAHYTAADIRQSISLRNPVICLIDYGRLPPDLKRDANYNGTHFVLAVGYDAGHVFVHDPLGNADTGAFVAYPDDVVNGVLRGGQCLVIMREYEVVAEKRGSKKRLMQPLD